MKIRTGIILCVMLFTLLLAGCAGEKWQSVKDGMTLTLQAGETVLVALDTYEASLNVWEHEGFDPDIVMVGDAEYHSLSKNPTPSGPLKAVFGIRGLKAGETQITFVYRHRGDKSVDETYTINVIVK